MLNISKRPVNMIIPTPGTFIKPNPNDSIPKIKIGLILEDFIIGPVRGLGGFLKVSLILENNLKSFSNLYPDSSLRKLLASLSV